MREKKYKLYTEHQIEEALKLCIGPNALTVRHAAKKFGVPRATLQLKLKTYLSNETIKASELIVEELPTLCGLNESCDFYVEELPIENDLIEVCDFVVEEVPVVSDLAEICDFVVEELPVTSLTESCDSMYTKII